MHELEYKGPGPLDLRAAPKAPWLLKKRRVTSTAIRVLVMETSSELQDVLCRFLGRCGLDVAGASSPVIAAIMLRQRRYDIVLSDISVAFAESDGSIRPIVHPTRLVTRLPEFKRFQTIDVAPGPGFVVFPG